MKSRIGAAFTDQVELRRDARQQAERDLDDEQHEHDRRGDADADDEDGAERARHQRRQLAGRRPAAGADRQRAVGRGQRLQQLVVAVDDQEHHHARGWRRAR